MQFIKNGPDIPERLLQAHEEGRVVFFCGAGVSYPAGLPGFRGLVDTLYPNLGDAPNPVERTAIKIGQKGGTSVYGLGRFPYTFYLSQAAPFCEALPRILDFMIGNGDKLAVKEDEDRDGLVARLQTVRDLFPADWGETPEVDAGDDITKA